MYSVTDDMSGFMMSCQTMPDGLPLTHNILCITSGQSKYGRDVAAFCFVGIPVVVSEDFCA